VCGDAQRVQRRPESEAATELAREAARRWLDEKVQSGEARVRVAMTSTAPEGVRWEAVCNARRVIRRHRKWG